MRKILIKGFWKKNLRNKLLFFAILLSVAIPIVLSGTTQNLMHQVLDENSRVYGIFTNIYYEEDAEKNIQVDETALHNKLSGFSYEQRGTMYIFSHILLESRKTCVLGYAEEEAVTLGSIQLKEGIMPKKTGEIALTESIKMEIAPKASLGDKINIAKKEYQLTGIVQDYGRLWPKGEQQVRKNSLVISAFLSKEEADSRETISRIHLFLSDLSVSNNVEDNGNH